MRNRGARWRHSRQKLHLRGQWGRGPVGGLKVYCLLHTEQQFYPLAKLPIEACFVQKCRASGVLKE